MADAAVARTLPLETAAGAVATPRFQADHLGLTVTGLSTALYAGLAAYLALEAGVAHGDAYSRFANAYYVFFSRDPHLAAIGFVWTPLPSLVEMLALPLNVLWPGILASGIAAGAMSTLFMAGAVWLMWLLLGDFRLDTPARSILTAAFALNPMVVYYAAVGTSEAPMLFCLLLTARSLYRWQRDRELRWLVYTGLALALAFLNRYEALAAAAGVALVVAVITFAWDARRSAVVADVAIVLLPVASIFAVWTLVSWVITGEAFSQFASAYGNSSQMAVWTAQGANETGDPMAVKAVRLFLRVTLIQAVWMPAAGVLFWQAYRRLDVRALSALAPLGSVLAFMSFEYVSGSIAPWLRYLIVIVPLGVVFTGAAVSAWRRRVVASAFDAYITDGQQKLARRLLLGFALAAIPISALGMLNPQLAIEESRDLSAILARDGCAPTRTDMGAVRCFGTEREIAAYLDSKDLPDGSVLLDTFSGFAIVLRSQHPRQFVITSDRDFMSNLVDPAGTGVEYLLVPPDTQHGTLDVVNRTWPFLYADGAGIATLEREYRGQDGGVAWRLYRVNPP